MARNVFVSTMSLNEIVPIVGQTDRPKSCMEWTMGLLDLCAADRPDLIVIPEMFGHLDEPLDERNAQPLDGPIVARTAEKARQYGCYVLCPLKLKDGDRLYNSALLLDRDGKVAGRYDKMRLTTAELDAGLTPGAEHNVMETDFGRLGVITCFDLNFDELGPGLRAGGAEIVAFNSMYDGGWTLNMWAYLHQYHVVSSVANGQGRVINPIGQLLAVTSLHKPYMTVEINLDCAVLHANAKRGLEAAKRELGREMDYDMSTEEARALLRSNSPDRSAADIMRKFGLETVDEFHAKARAANDAARRGA